jgi:hypothetical protein
MIPLSPLFEKIRMNKLLRQKNIYFLVLLNLCVSVFPQSTSAEAQLYYAFGTDFVLTSKGQRTVYQADSIGDITLDNADMIQTGSNSTVEISLLPGNVLVKIAGNTSFVFNGYNEKNGAVSLQVLYGRIRVKTDKDVEVQVGNGIVHFNKGDIGFDFIVQPSKTQGGSQSSQPSLRVYGFSGTAVLNLNSGANIPAIDIGAYETVSLELFSSLAFAERKPLDEINIDLWNKNNFQGAQSIGLIGSPNTPDGTGYNDKPSLGYGARGKSITALVGAILQGAQGKLGSSILYLLPKK